MGSTPVSGTQGSLRRLSEMWCGVGDDNWRLRANLPLPDVQQGVTMKLVGKYPHDYARTVNLAISQSHAPLCAVPHWDEVHVYLKPGHSNVELEQTRGEFEHLLYLGTKGRYGHME